MRRVRVGAFVLLALGAFAAPAQATTRNVVAVGGATAGNCIDAPCTLKYAVETASAANDVVLVASGTYAVAGEIIPKAGVTIQGAARGAARPLLQAPNAVFGSNSPIRDLVLRDLRFESQSASLRFPYSDVGGSVFERLSIHVTSPYPALLNCVGGSVLIRDSEFVAEGPHGPVFGTIGSCTWNLRNNLFRSSGGLGVQFRAGRSTPGGDETGQAVANIRNSILFGYISRAEDTAGSTVSGSVGASRLGDSLWSQFTDAGGNITAPPVFVDAAARDFHQLPESPTRNAGIADLLTSSIDIDGEPRPQGVAPDIGPDEIGPIAPVATTGDATEVTTSSATLTGSADPNGVAATYRFEYGSGGSTPEQPLPGGHDPVAVQAPVSGLPAGTTVAYRLVVETAEGTGVGAMRELTTLSLAPVATATVAPPPPKPLILECLRTSITLVDVVRRGARVRITGQTTPGASRPVDVFFFDRSRRSVPARRVVTTARAADGTFAATVPAPPRSVRSAAYYAQDASGRSASLKADRRMFIDSAVRAGSVVTLRGHAVKPLTRSRQRVVVTVQTDCARRVVAGRTRLDRAGRFTLRVPAPAGGALQALYRAETRVLRHRRTTRTAKTFTLLRPVSLG